MGIFWGPLLNLSYSGPWIHLTSWTSLCQFSTKIWSICPETQHSLPQIEPTGLWRESWLSNWTSISGIGGVVNVRDYPADLKVHGRAGQQTKSCSSLVHANWMDEWMNTWKAVFMDGHVLLQYLVPHSLPELPCHPPTNSSVSCQLF